MKGIQNDIKVALKGSENEVIKTPLLTFDSMVMLDIIKSEREIRNKYKLKKSTFSIAMMIVTSGGESVWSITKKFHVGYSQFYRDIEDLKSKDLIVMITEGRTKMYYPTKKLVEVVKKNYQEIQKLVKKPTKQAKAKVK